MKNEKKMANAALELDIDSLDLNTFFQRPDVLEKIAREEYLLFSIVNGVKRRQVSGEDNDFKLGLKKKFVTWETNSHGFDYGSGFMSLYVSIRKIYAKSDDDPQLWVANLYFNSHDDSDFSIRSPVSSLEDAKKIYASLLEIFYKIDRVPTYEEANLIARRCGCYVDTL